MPASPKKKILIIDDEASIAELIADFCQHLGFKTKTLNGGEDILQEVKAFSPDLITLDIIMPEHSGLEIIEMLKHDEDTSAIPVLIVSGIGGNESVEEALKKSKGVLSKPIKIGTLKEKIESVLNP